MIARFRAGRSRAAPAGPADTRLYAIGDIHGRLDLLRQLSALVHADAYQRQAPRNVVISLGDYIDRGPQSREVIEFLLRERLPGFEHVHLKGNHEDIMMHFLADASFGPNWLTYGGRATLESYGIAAPEAHAGDEEMERARLAFARALPPDHLDFLRGLKLLHEEGDYAFVHAGVKPGVALDAQREEDLLWIRDEFLSSNAEFGKIVVHGHTIAPTPDVRRNRIGIDTGAFMSDRLTCLVVAGEEWSFLQT
jgi:serine/threonine protein phosphatase 1